MEQVIESNGIQHGTAHLLNSTRELDGMDSNVGLCWNASSSSGGGGVFSSVQSL